MSFISLSKKRKHLFIFALAAVIIFAMVCTQLGQGEKQTYASEPLPPNLLPRGNFESFILTDGSHALSTATTPAHSGSPAGTVVNNEYTRNSNAAKFLMGYIEYISSSESLSLTEGNDYRFSFDATAGDVKNGDGTLLAGFYPILIINYKNSENANKVAEVSLANPSAPSGGNGLYYLENTEGGGAKWNTFSYTFSYNIDGSSLKLSSAPGGAAVKDASENVVSQTCAPYTDYIVAEDFASLTSVSFRLRSPGNAGLLDMYVDNIGLYNTPVANTVSIVVTDVFNNPINGADIYLPYTNQHFTTDSEGNAEIVSYFNENAIITKSGYVANTIKMDGNTELVVKLSENLLPKGDFEDFQEGAPLAAPDNPSYEGSSSGSGQVENNAYTNYSNAFAFRTSYLQYNTAPGLLEQDVKYVFSFDAASDNTRPNSTSPTAGVSPYLLVYYTNTDGVANQYKSIYFGSTGTSGADGLYYLTNTVGGEAKWSTLGFEFSFKLDGSNLYLSSSALYAAAGGVASVVPQTCADYEKHLFASDIGTITNMHFRILSPGNTGLSHVYVDNVGLRISPYDFTYNITVTDNSGAPIEGAQVALTRAKTVFTTDSSGVAVVSAAYEDNVTITANGHETKYGFIDKDTGDITVQLTPSVVADPYDAIVTVKNISGAPVAGASVRLTISGVTKTTNALGVASFTSEWGEDAVITASGYVKSTVSINKDAPEVTVYLNPNLIPRGDFEAFETENGIGSINAGTVPAYDAPGGGSLPATASIVNNDYTYNSNAVKYQTGYVQYNMVRGLIAQNIKYTLKFDASAGNTRTGGATPTAGITPSLIVYYKDTKGDSDKVATIRLASTGSAGADGLFYLTGITDGDAIWNTLGIEFEYKIVNNQFKMSAKMTAAAIAGTSANVVPQNCADYTDHVFIDDIDSIINIYLRFNSSDNVALSYLYLDNIGISDAPDPYTATVTVEDVNGQALPGAQVRVNATGEIYTTDDIGRIAFDVDYATNISVNLEGYIVSQVALNKANREVTVVMVKMYDYNYLNNHGNLATFGNFETTQDFLHPETNPSTELNVAIAHENQDAASLSDDALFGEKSLKIDMNGKTGSRVGLRIDHNNIVYGEKYWVNVYLKTDPGMTMQTNISLTTLFKEYDKINPPLNISLDQTAVLENARLTINDQWQKLEYWFMLELVDCEETGLEPIIVNDEAGGWTQTFNKVLKISTSFWDFGIHADAIFYEQLYIEPSFSVQNGSVLLIDGMTVLKEYEATATVLGESGENISGVSFELTDYTGKKTIINTGMEGGKYALGNLLGPVSVLPVANDIEYTPKIISGMVGDAVFAPNFSAGLTLVDGDGNKISGAVVRSRYQGSTIQFNEANGNGIYTAANLDGSATYSVTIVCDGYEDAVVVISISGKEQTVTLEKSETGDTSPSPTTPVSEPKGCKGMVGGLGVSAALTALAAAMVALRKRKSNLKF